MKSSTEAVWWTEAVARYEARNFPTEPGSLIPVDPEMESVFKNTVALWTKKSPLVKEIERLQWIALDLIKKKNADYAWDEDPFKNFKLVESAWITTVERGMLVRMSDKFQRISNLIDSEATVKDESIEDTLLDLANYSLLLLAYRNMK